MLPQTIIQNHLTPLDLNWFTFSQACMKIAYINLLNPISTSTHTYFQPFHHTSCHVNFIYYEKLLGPFYVCLRIENCGNIQYFNNVE